MPEHIQRWQQTTPFETAHAPADLPRHDPSAPDRRGQSHPAQGAIAKPPATNLLLPRSPLIGRDHEVASIQHLLLQDEIGLLTLTGPGGIGKTRLALQVAANLLDHFVEGVYFISLAPIREAELVGVTIAQTLGVREVGGLPLLESLQDYIQDRQMLLVLDNFEQIAAAAPLVGMLLAGGCTAGSGADTLLLGGLTHSLATGPYYHDGLTATPSVISTIVISGGVGGAIVERSGAAKYRLFHVGQAGDLTLQNVTVRSGNVVGGGAVVTAS